MRDIRRRIKSVQNTQQITRAMKMVAAAKLRRAQGAAEAARPYTRALREMVARLASRNRGFDHPLLHEAHAAKRVGYLVITADRGLCGAYNANLLRRAVLELAREEREVVVVAVGRKARDFFVRRRYRLLAQFIRLGDDPRYELAQSITAEVERLFAAGEFAELKLVYTRFVSAMQHKVEVVHLLPLYGGELEGTQGGQNWDYIYEPTARTVLAPLLERYVADAIFGALLEAKASEQGARMVAMDSASKNSDKLIKRLTLRRNKARQAAITKELAELVGGAEALAEG